MKCLNRRYERNNDITGFLKKNGFDIKFINDYSVYENRNKFLEGTGSLVLDRTNKLAFCALSPRSDKELLQIFCDEYSFEPVIFTAYQNHNNRRAVIYHTNVVMSICSDYSIVCFDAIDSFKEKNHVYKKLKEVGKTIIEINENQLLSFAGNVIELKNIDNESFLVMSSRALNSLNNNQKKMICKFSKIISSDISTIEDVGGGGIRCMIAEIFN